MMLLFSNAIDHGESFDVESRIVTAKGSVKSG
jgi:hypothetical protein